MDFRGLCTFFGGCILPEDIRTDLVKSHRDLDGCTAANDTPNGHQSLLLNVVFHSLSGDLRKAAELLEVLESKATAVKDTDLLVRVPVYRLHLQRIEKAAPPLDFWSNRSTEIGALDDARHNRKDIPQFHRLLRDVEARVDSHFKNISLPKIQVLEPQTLLTMWSMVHYTWNGSYLHHPEFKSKYPGMSCRVISDGMGEFTSAHIGSAKRRGLEETAFVMQLLNATKQKASGKRTQYLEPEFEEAGKHDNRTRNALRLLVIGDFQLSKPFTSPLALNLMLYAAGPGWNDSQWDAMENDTLCAERAEAEALNSYKASFRLFEAEDCNRGMAAIHLRRGCVFMMKAIDTLGSGSVTVTCKELIMEATIEFNKAEPLFKLDATHLCIIDAYQLLCQIVREENLEVKRLAELAQQIGRWGAERSNPRPSRFSGILLLRTGRRLSRKKVVERAWICCVCARIIFAALRDPTLEAKAVEAQALYYQEIGHTALAKQYLQCNQRVVKEAFEYVAGVIKTCSESHQKRLDEFQKKRYDSFLKLGDKIFVTHQEKQRWHSDIDSMYSIDQNAVPSADTLPKEDSIDASLVRLEIYAQRLSIDAEREKANFLDFTDRMRRFWKQHQDAIRVQDSDKAAKALHLSKDEGTDGDPSSGLFDSHWTPQFPDFPKYSIRDAVVFCYQGRFDDARERLLTLPPIKVPNFRIGVPGLASHEAASIHVADRILHLQINMHLQLCYVSKNWQRGHNILVELGDRQNMFFEELERSSDVDRWMTMVALGYIRSQRSMASLESALEWYEKAYHVVTKNRLNLVDIQDRRAGGRLISPVQVSEGLAKIGTNLHVKGERISPFRTFGMRLLDINYRNARIKLQNIDLAVLFFEQGRAGVLADMILLHGDSSHIEDWLTLRAFASDKTETASLAQFDVSDHDQITSEIVEAALRDQQILQLRLCALETTLREWVVADKIYKSIPDNTVVVHVNTDLEQTNILYITNQGVQLLHQATLAAYDLNTTILQYLDEFRLRKLPKEQPLREKLPKYEQYDRLVKKLSERIVSPANALLKEAKTVVFVPSKLLHNFPVSALTLEGVPLCESKSVYFCPSLRVYSLLARRFAQPKQPEQASGTSSPGFVTFLATRKNIKSKDTPLDVAAAFAITNADKFQFKAVPADALERSSLLDEMRASNVVLVSSHGKVGKDTPWNNNLSFGNPLSVTEMLGKTFSAELVVFQACLSSASSLDDGDDVIGFSHAVLSSGTNSFIGAFWEVNELAASLLISFFFDHRKSADSSMTIADALREAQMKLRRMKRAELVKILSSVRETIGRAVAENWFAEYDVNVQALARAVRREIRGIEATVEPECPFDHPFFWAPFTIVGYGHQKASC